MHVSVFSRPFLFNVRILLSLLFYLMMAALIPYFQKDNITGHQRKGDNKLRKEPMLPVKRSSMILETFAATSAHEAKDSLLKIQK